MTKDIYDIPNELLYKICEFCDKRTIMNLSEVSRIWYFITKKAKKKIIDYITPYNIEKNGVYRDNLIRTYIETNNIQAMSILLELNVIEPHRKLYLNGDIFNIFNRDDCISILDYVAKSGYITMIILLLEFGCDLNRKNENGTTPLINLVRSAYSTEHDYMVRFLFECGADPNIQDINGFSALDYSSGYGKTSLRNILQEYGASHGNGWWLDGNGWLQPHHAFIESDESDTEYDNDSSEDSSQKDMDYPSTEEDDDDDSD